MKSRFLFILMFAFSTALHSQEYALTVINGYGSGLYSAGETVHIWSGAYHGKEYFDTWSGDITLVNDPLDWHTTLVMPAHDVMVEALIGELSDEVIFFTTKVQAIDTLKEVWFAFPDATELRGLVWLFHGTNGTGKNFFVSTNMLTVTKKLLSEGYAVISLDCEEKTYDEDFNMDGVYRWDYTFDSLQNIDLRNVKAIRDTIIARGLIDGTTPQIAYGYSAGGAFATHIASLLQWHVGVSHNSPGVPWVPSFGQTPILFSMTENDNHPDVGQEGNAAAESYSAQLLQRDICSEFHLTLSQPLYPERFSRDSTIGLALSAAIFQELKNHGVIDDDHYLLYTSDQLAAIINADPVSWPVIINLTTSQQLSIADEIDETFATHRFNSDRFGADLRFIMEQCEGTTSVETTAKESLKIYPNPAGNHLFLESENGDFVIYDIYGREVLNGKGAEVDISLLTAGLYFIQTCNRAGCFVKGL